MNVHPADTWRDYLPLPANTENFLVKNIRYANAETEALQPDNVKEQKVKRDSPGTSTKGLLSENAAPAGIRKKSKIFITIDFILVINCNYFSGSCC